MSDLEFIIFIIIAIIIWVALFLLIPGREVYNSDKCSCSSILYYRCENCRFRDKYNK